ncbi:YHYH domain-containing protein [Neobacillus sp. WH10]|uniref:YHYH domain-containing protein n=1 Tax=Neobacillus sp. WH10 TaxID=3047873 RepID=UPI0024C1B6F8|nr:YHYH domain-containing protein [Neobacillus sp. WH10]WHY75698.1 YHYH domain-containing protein [Neobacillus sp. WH10]
MKKSLLAFICFIVLTSLPISAFAHSGRTDAYGGHNCSDKSKAKGLCTGYHYHNGGSSSGSTYSTTSVAKSGWENIGGKWYYYSSGKVHKGWLAEGNSWYYLDSNGVMKTGWIYTGGAWYYLDSSGAMKTGWVKDSGTWYYLQSSGVMKTGWVKDGGTWFYLQSSGAMKTGWVKDGNTWYYLKSNGAMATGWVKDGGTWFYLQSSGAMKTGWLKDGANWYFLNSNGTMKTGWLQLGNYTYFLETNGIMQTGWIEHQGYQYYFDQNGNMARNTVVDGITLGPDGKADPTTTPLFKNIKEVADQYGYTVQFDYDFAKIMISNGDETIAVARNNGIYGMGQYIDFLSTVSTKMGAPETKENIMKYFDQITNPENPYYYERSDFVMWYEIQSGWVAILWGDW